MAIYLGPDNYRNSYKGNANNVPEYITGAPEQLRIIFPCFYMLPRDHNFH
jgi:hypothetical protein